MNTKAVRLHGKDKIQLDEFELPQMGDDEILAKVVSSSICMSDYKALRQGEDHKRVPEDISENPIMMGHEICGEIVKVGAKWAGKFKVGQKFSVQPALNYQGSLAAPGYSFRWVGGYTQYMVIPNVVMEMNCLLPYNGDAFFMGSLSEPLSCIVGTYHAMYHTEAGSYEHKMEIVEGGNVAILAGAGPMGLGTIDYGLHGSVNKPKLMVVTDIDDARLNRAAELLTVEDAAKNGIKLVYLNTAKCDDPVAELMALTDGEGYNDVFVMAPVKPVIEQGDAILGDDGCLNFFAGPGKVDFFAEMNFYKVHYASHHIVGTSGGNTADMIESLELFSQDLLNPAVLITHVGGLNAVPNTVDNLPKIPGGKKLIYTHIDLPLTAIDEFETLGKENPLFAELAKIVAKTKGLWSLEAEQYLLEHAPQL